MSTCHRYLLCLCALLCAMPTHAAVLNIDDMISSQPGLAKQCAATSASAVQKALAMAQPGDALVLSRRLPLGDVVVGDVRDGVEVLGGFDGTMRVTGAMRNWDFVYSCANTDLVIEEGAQLEGSRFFCSFSGGRFIDKSSSTYEAVGLGFAPRLNGALAKSTVDSRPGASGIKWGVGVYQFDNFGSKVVWMPAYYVDGAGAKNETETPQVLIKNATDGGKWLFAIEAEQAAHCPAVRVQNSSKLQLYSGSTEGDNYQTGAVYYIENSNDVVLGMRRFFSNHKGTGWSGTPGMSLVVDGGSGNIIHNLVDIANPATFSLASTDPKLQIWQSFFEDETKLESSTFQYMVTHQGMVDEVNTWSEPVMVDNEVVLTDGGTDLVAATDPKVPVPPAFDFQHWMDQSKALSKSRGAAKVSRAFRSDKSFGAALLQAGADPTGRQVSDRAFAKVLAEGNTITVGPGRYRLNRPLALLNNGRHRAVAILGAGRGRTKLVAGAGSRAALDLTPAASLAKTATSCGAASSMAVIDGVTLSGGENGVLVPEGVSLAMSDFAVEGFAKAGIVHATSQIDVPAQEGVSCDGDSHCNDMHLYENGTISGGEYGIYYAGFADKQGIRNITFSGQSKAGIWARNNNLFHGWIGSCTFENIDGPAIDLSGGADLVSKGYGYYTQWVTMIENCTFTECGSTDRAAVDYGYTDINMLCNSRITTKNKTIKYGFLGSVAEISNVVIDVNASKAALALRNCRATEASRTPASIVHTVDTKGGDLLVVDGYPAGDGGPSDDPASEYQYTTRLATDWDGSSTHSGRKWWKDGYEWAFTMLIYNSTIAGEKKVYVLRNATGFEKDLMTGETRIPSNALGYERVGEADRHEVYDLTGRRILRSLGTRAPELPQGLYVVSERGAVGKLKTLR